MTKQPNSRTCFLCGRENHIGLKMSWYSDIEKQQVISSVTVPPEFNGFPGFVHGGIIAALLDETAGRAIIINGNHDDIMATASLEISYQKPTPIDVPLTLVGWVVRPGTNRARVAGEIRLSDGTVTASCTALIVRPPQAFYANWEPEKENWKISED